MKEINHCEYFTNFISDINNTQIGNVKDFENYLKTYGILWEYYRDEPNDNITVSGSFKFKAKITRSTLTSGSYLRNFWRILEILIIKCEINLTLTWSAKCVIPAATGESYVITNTKHYISVVTLSTQDNTKLLKQIKSNFKRTINWNKYHSKAEIKDQTLY